jgi:hypothetical protein
VKQVQLRIGDVGVALELALDGGLKLQALAERTSRSIGEVHNAISRLGAARLLRPDSREVEREPLLRFIRWGVPHAFPPSVGPVTRGVATAALGLAQTGTPGEPEETEFVWPDPSGVSRGQAFAPPYPRAPRLVATNPELRSLLALLDLVRVGGTREQTAAVDEIARRITKRSN